METDLNQIRNKLIDRVYLGLIIFIIPVLSASLFRITKTGWDWIYAVQIILAITANLVYVFRSKIVLNVKTHFFCILFIIISFTGALKFGIAGAYIFCILSVIIATLIFGKRTGYIYLIISLSDLSIIGFFYGNKKIQTLVNLQTYNTNGLTWIILVASLFWLLGIVLFAINLFNTYFEKNIYALIQKSKEQEIAQQKIKESEERYHSLIEHAGDAIFLVNQDTSINDVNTSGCNLLGYSHEELLGMKIEDICSVDELEKNPLQWELLNTNKTVINERKMLRKDGTEVETEVSSKVLEGKGFLAIIRDITERKKVEEQIIKSEQKYRSLIEQASDPIFVTDFKGNFVDVNASLCNIFGYTKEELLKMNISSLIEPAQLKERPLMFDELANGNHLLSTRRAMRKDGSLVEVEANVKKTDDTHIMVIARDITERKRLEAELIVHKEQLRLFIEHSPASLAMLDTDMRYIATSRRWLNDYNLGEVELIGKTHYEVFPEITQEWKDIHQRCLKGAIEKNEEDSFTRLDGSTDWLRWEIRPWHKSTGEIGGIIMFTEVITDRILANQKLVASEQIRRHIMNSALDAIVCMDINGGITLWTPQAEKIFGWNETDIIGKQMSDVIIPHNYRKAHEMGLSNYLQTGSGNVLNKTIEITALNKSGREFPIELSIVHVLNGESEFFCAFIRDITERKKIEKSLKDSEEKHRALIENIHDTIILVNKNTEVIYQSPSFVRTAGYELGELKTTSAFEFVHPDDLQNSQNLFKEAFLSPGISLPLQYRIRHKSGEYIWIEGNVTNLLDNESVKAFIVIYRNITERKKDEAELIRYNAELKKTNTELDRFVYSTSHDLRAPLKSMLGLINIAKEDVPPGNDMQIERLSMLNKSVVKLDNFIEDILHYSRNKGMKLATDEINFKEIIDGILEGNKFIEGINTIDFQVKINTDTKFLSDAARLKVILNNVITNAIKYRDHAKENSFVKIDVQCNDKKAIVTIEDNGIGIAEKDHEKVFEMFYRATILSSGSGLGLYIVKETLEKLGGKIKLESKLNAGTKVISEIPNQLISLN
jgi:PAS domain S-box-containing protein